MSTPMETSKLKLIHKVNNKRRREAFHIFHCFSWNLKLTNLIFSLPEGNEHYMITKLKLDFT